MRSVELATVFASLLAARLAAALWSPISDCDETFNYWEPLHYRVHGSGFQTWEYSPAYAIRSYAYVEAHALIVRLAAVLGFDERSQFYVLRAVLALICALSETMLVDAVSRATILAGPAVARWTWLFLLASTGMFVASTGFLPSTTALYTFMLATAAWLRRRDLLAIFFVALGALFAWPFSGALGVPIAVDLIFRRGKLVSFVRGAVLAAVIILVPLVLFDSWMYGKLVVAPLNIVLYNVLSSNTSSELYGTEPWWFYFANGALNFNIAFAMALVSPILALVFGRSMRWSQILLISPLFIWLGIFVSQDHKEERYATCLYTTAMGFIYRCGRFLFPVYGHVALAAGICASHVADFLNANIRPLRNVFAAVVVAVFLVFCALRTGIVWQGYTAPQHVYNAVSQLDTSEFNAPANICVGKEWYRFQSAFFLPEDGTLQFLRSEFRGQLPKQYAKEHGTTAVHAYFNEMNEEQLDRYVCAFIFAMPSESLSGSAYECVVEGCDPPVRLSG
eukprot:m.217243 g.217243  ORF g.217243 m.217243 type:complete len:507 (-) comp10785_c1_seq26:958-2478(-)